MCVCVCVCVCARALFVFCGCFCLHLCCLIAWMERRERKYFMCKQKLSALLDESRNGENKWWLTCSNTYVVKQRARVLVSKTNLNPSFFGYVGGGGVIYLAFCLPQSSFLFIHQKSRSKTFVFIASTYMSTSHTVDRDCGEKERHAMPCPSNSERLSVFV